MLQERSKCPPSALRVLSNCSPSGSGRVIYSVFSRSVKLQPGLQIASKLSKMEPKRRQNGLQARSKSLPSGIKTPSECTQRPSKRLQAAPGAAPVASTELPVGHVSSGISKVPPNCLQSGSEFAPNLPQDRFLSYSECIASPGDGDDDNDVPTQQLSDATKQHLK